MSAIDRIKPVVEVMAQQQESWLDYWLDKIVRWRVTNLNIEVLNPEHLDTAQQHLKAGSGVEVMALPHTSIYDPAILMWYVLRELGGYPEAHLDNSGDLSAWTIFFLSSIKFFRDIEGIDNLSSKEKSAARGFAPKMGVNLIPLAQPSVMVKLKQAEPKLGQDTFKKINEELKALNAGAIEKYRAALMAGKIAGMYPQGTRTAELDIISKAAGEIARRTGAYTMMVRHEGDILFMRSGVLGLLPRKYSGRLVVDQPRIEEEIRAIAKQNIWATGEREGKPLTMSEDKVFLGLTTSPATPPTDLSQRVQYGRYREKNLRGGKFLREVPSSEINS